MSSFRTRCHLLDLCLEESTEHLTFHPMEVMMDMWTEREKETEIVTGRGNENENENERGSVTGIEKEIGTEKDM